MAVRNSKNMNGAMCKCPCHKFKKVFMGIFFMVFGLVFLFNNVGYSSDSFTELAWPVLIVLVGVSFVVKGFHPCNCCNKH